MTATATRRSGVSGIERRFGPDEIIVSKTDVKGRITYANDVFLRVAEYSEAELIGAPHNIIRHPAMPRCVFRVLWETIQAGKEIFAYVINRSKSGGHYWVFAHVTPTFDAQGGIIGYHSSRRCPNRKAIQAIEPVYATLLGIEANQSTPRAAWQASLPKLMEFLAQRGVSYDELVFSLAAL